VGDLRTAAGGHRVDFEEDRRIAAGEDHRTAVGEARHHSVMLGVCRRHIAAERRTAAVEGKGTCWGGYYRRSLGSLWAGVRRRSFGLRMVVVADVADAAADAGDTRRPCCCRRGVSTTPVSRAPSLPDPGGDKPKTQTQAHRRSTLPILQHRH